MSKNRDAYIPIGRFSRETVPAASGARRAGLFLLVWLVAIALLPGSTAARLDDGGSLQHPLAISHLTLTPADPAMLISLEVSGISAKQMKETVESGFPWLLSYRVELYRKRRLVPDLRVHAWDLSHTVRYDNLKDEFLVTRDLAPEGPAPSETHPPRVVKTLDSARTLAARINGLSIGVTRHVDPVRYVLRVRATAEPVTRKKGSFISSLLTSIPIFRWHDETAWYIEEFEF